MVSTKDGFTGNGQEQSEVVGHSKFFPILKLI